jgi:hypothetical protein
MPDACVCGWCMSFVERGVPMQPLPESPYVTENRELRRLILAMAVRIADQSELLSKRSEKKDMDEKHYQKLLAKALDEQERFLDVIADMVKQHCYRGRNASEPNLYDSSALTANAEAMETLAEHDRFIIDRGFGRVICGYFPEDRAMAPNEQASSPEVR